MYLMYIYIYNIYIYIYIYTYISIYRERETERAIYVCIYLLEFRVNPAVDGSSSSTAVSGDKVIYPRRLPG